MAQQQEYFGQRDVAARFGISEHTLATWRTKGIGPRYLKVGSAVRYRLADVEDWIAGNTVVPAGGAQ